MGLDAATAAQIVAEAGFDETDRAAIAEVLVTLGRVYADNDATLVEVNPLVKTGDGAIIALDGKITLDDNAAFRHPEWEQYAEGSGPTRSKCEPRRRASTTSSSTAPWVSSVTAPDW